MYTIRYVAALSGSTECVTLLLDRYAPHPSIRPNFSPLRPPHAALSLLCLFHPSPFFLPAYNKYSRSGAFFDAKSNLGLTPCFVAVSVVCFFPSVTKNLIAASVFFFSNGTDNIIRAAHFVLKAWRGHIDILKTLVGRGADLSVRDGSRSRNASRNASTMLQT